MLVRGVGGPVVPATSAAGIMNPKLLMHPWTNWTSGGGGGGGGVGLGADVLPKLVATTSVPKGLSITKSASKAVTQGKKGKNVSPVVCSGGVSQVAAVNFPVSSSTSVNGSALVAAATGPKPQTKITGFFKSQMKSTQQMPQVITGVGSGVTIAGMMTVPPPLVKKDLTNLVIRSKEFPKINQQAAGKRGGGGGKKTGGEKKPRGGTSAKNASLPVPGTTIKDIIMKKPVNIAPRVDHSVGHQQQQQQLQQLSKPQNLQPMTAVSSELKPENGNMTMSRTPQQQPQLVLTAFRLTPDMLQQGGLTQSQLRLQNGTASQSGQNLRGGGPVGDNKINTVQFQYPLNGSFVSFANMMPQLQQGTNSLLANNGQTTGLIGDGKQGASQQQQMHQQQQQIFLSQLGAALGKPGSSTPTTNSSAQFILNGHLVKLANQGTTIEATTTSTGGSHRLMTATQESGELKSQQPPTLISAIPTMLTTASPTKQSHHNHHQGHQPQPPVLMAMGQNGQFILNANALPSLLGTAGSGNSGIPQTMPSLQPISLSSLSEPTQHQQLQMANNSHLMKTPTQNAMSKGGRVVPPLAPSSSPPELVFLQPIAKAIAAAKRGEDKLQARNPMKASEVAKAPPMSSKPPVLPANKTDLSGTAKVVENKQGPVAKKVDQEERKTLSKVVTTTEVVRKQQTFITTTTKTTTTMTRKAVEEKEDGKQKKSLSVVGKDQEIEIQLKEVIANLPVVVVDRLVTPVIMPALLAIPPSLTSPKSLVLEKIKLKSETTIRAATAIKESFSDLRVEISTDCLDVAKRQLGVLVDQQHFHQECAKSPILSQPKTIRFPVRGGTEFNGKKGLRKSGGVSYVSGHCYWEECNERFENSSKLLDHLQMHHVNAQDDKFRCQWQGCRVNGRESSSKRWLEGHVLAHGGSKTFKCIFDGCGLRFSSQVSGKGTGAE